MHSVFLVLACLASAGRARTVPAAADENQQLRALASLLVTIDPASAYRPAAPGARLHASRPARAGVGPHMQQRPVMKMKTSMGEIKAELYLEEMPITVSNFVDLAKSGFYNGLSFHRVIPDFVAQTGCPYSKDPEDPKQGTGRPEPGSYRDLMTQRPIPRDNGNILDEFPPRHKISNEPGTLAMANNGQRDSGGSQFFINVANNKDLDWWDLSESQARHPVFGKVTDGMSIVEEIVKVETNEKDKPITPIIVESVTVDVPEIERDLW